MSKQLKTQTAVLKRQIKDVAVSRKEYDEEIARQAKIDQTDEFRVKQQLKVVEMAKQSIEDAEKAVSRTAAALEQLVHEASKDPTIEQTLLDDAKLQIEAAKYVSAK